MQTENQDNFYRSQPDYIHKPIYTYRDQSLDPDFAAFEYVKQQRRNFLLRRRLMQICFVLFPIIGTAILTAHYASAYQSYIPATCTIIDRQVIEHINKDKHGHETGRTYYPEFSYTVHTANGDVETSGYDGPSAVRYSYSSNAKDIVNRYQDGQTVPCWHSPVTPSKAFLVYYGFTANDASGINFWGIVGFGVFSVLAYLIASKMMWRTYALGKRGVVTHGRVIRHREVKNKGKVTVYSILRFQALGDVGYREMSEQGRFEIGTYRPVCYDPLFPGYNRAGEWPDTSNIYVGLLISILLVIIGLIVLLIVWLIP